MVYPQRNQYPRLAMAMNRKRNARKLERGRGRTPLTRLRYVCLLQRPFGGANPNNGSNNNSSNNGNSNNGNSGSNSSNNANR